MGLLVAFGTNDGKNLNSDHFGMAKYYHVYDFSGEQQAFVERRKNVDFKGNKSIKHGDPEKAKATSAVLEGVDALVGKRFGPNLPRLLKKYVCVVVRENAISDVIEIMKNSMGRIVEAKNKGENRQHIVLHR